MQVPLFFVVFLGMHSFQHDVGFGWFFNSNHLQYVALDGHSLGEGCLTDLALELREIIRQHNIIELLFDLAVDPILQTPNMNKLAGSFADTRANQWIFLC